ncbi:Rho-associated protein kinase 1, partial [Ophiophagus hannah]
ILYANEGECRKDLEVESVQPAEKTNFLHHKGHEFVPTLYHFPANCEACAKPLWHVFKPPPAVECRRCHVKCHKDHLDKKEELIAPCKVSYDITSARDMLLLASCQEDQKKWVSHLIKKLPKTPPSSFVRASPRTLSTRSTANQSFRKVKNTSAKARALLKIKYISWVINSRCKLHGSDMVQSENGGLFSPYKGVQTGCSFRYNFHKLQG